MKNKDEIVKILMENGFIYGRIISACKKPSKNCICVWNSNFIVRSLGKIWFGDINITKDKIKLKQIAEQIGEPIYILRELDARFDNEKKPIEELIKKAVWSTNL